MKTIDSRLFGKWRFAGVAGLSVSLLASTLAFGQVAPAVAKPDGLPRFKKIDLLKIDGKVVGDNDKITFGSPEFADWDGDGKTDLILGYWASWGIGPGRGAGDGGKIRFYKNVSKTPIPEYQDMGDLKCDGGLVRLAEA